MGTLFLASTGVSNPVIRGELLKVLPAVDKLRIDHIVTASLIKDDRGYVERDLQAMKEMGFLVEDIDIVGKTVEELKKILKDKDIIYMSGGDGCYLLKHIRLSGFDVVVKEFLKQGKIYFGASVGAYVACPTIEMYLWKKEKEMYGLTDLRAMNLVPFLITAHYEIKKRELILKGIQSTSYPVRILRDGQAILVRDGNVYFIGEEKEVVFSETGGEGDV